MSRVTERVGVAFICKLTIQSQGRCCEHRHEVTFHFVFSLEIFPTTMPKVSIVAGPVSI